MVNMHTALVSLINTATGISPDYELSYEQGTLPAITYSELDNSETLTGDTLNYSELRYQIRIHSYSLREALSLQELIDTAMRAEGWVRYNSIELTDSRNAVIKILRYVATGYEEV